MADDFLIFIEIVRSNPWQFLPAIFALIVAFVTLPRLFYPALFAAYAVIWLGSIYPLLAYFETIGTDSLFEASSFELMEASFFISTLPNPFQTGLVRLLAPCFVLAVAVSVPVRLTIAAAPWKVSRSKRYFRLIALTLIVVLPFTFGYKVVAFMISTGDANRKIEANFQIGPPLEKVIAVPVAQDPVRLIVYIGESTTVMNMQIYGYPRPTTPELSRLHAAGDSNLLVFDNVFSTHTHTSQSLLRALSVGVADGAGETIENAVRTSVPQALNRLGLKTRLISNQGQSGSWNLAGTVLFAGLDRRYSTATKTVGNLDFGITRPYDHAFLGDELKTIAGAEMGKASEIYFLHSYAGHGPYIDYIPEDFRRLVDDRIAGLGEFALRGDMLGSNPISHIVEGYDATVRYIDFSLAQLIKTVRASSAPTVVLYFSDHGESVFSARGHDSNRFIHEMARVPFLVFFNDSARTAIPDRFAWMRNLAEQSKRTPTTLEQVPATLFALLGLDMDAGQAEALGIDIPAPVGASDDRNVIVKRTTVEDDTYVRIAAAGTVPPRTGGSDNSDIATRIYRKHLQFRDADSFLCYHRSDSVATILRGLLVTDCVEFDLTIGASGSLDIVHPPKEPSGLRLSDVATVLNGRAASVWIDAKNIDDADNCGALAAALPEMRLSRDILVEFPSTSAQSLDGLRPCAQRLHADGFRTSYYVPVDTSVACAKSLGGATAPAEVCLALWSGLKPVLSSGLFTDISFDYRAIRAIEDSHIFDLAQSFNWNTWNIDPDRINDEVVRKFRSIIPITNDINTY